MSIKNGSLLVLTGMSGSGKDTVMKYLLNHPVVNFQRIVTCTTREPRGHEVHGKDYFFLTEADFKKKIAEGEMIEHVLYGSHYKGTTKSQLMEFSKGKNIIWRIETSRAAGIDEFIKDKFEENEALKIIESTKVVFLDVHEKNLRKRFLKRENNPDLNEFELRLKQDSEIFNSHRHKFHHIIDNNKSIHKTVDKIVSLFL